MALEIQKNKWDAKSMLKQATKSNLSWLWIWNCLCIEAQPRMRAGLQNSRQIASMLIISKGFEMDIFLSHDKHGLKINSQSAESGSDSSRHHHAADLDMTHTQAVLKYCKNKCLKDLTLYSTTETAAFLFSLLGLISSDGPTKDIKAIWSGFFQLNALNAQGFLLHFLITVLKKFFEKNYMSIWGKFNAFTYIWKTLSLLRLQTHCRGS